MDAAELVQCCLQDNPQAQKALFGRYSGKMMMVCKRYAKSQEEAEDFLQEGFIRMFKYLKSYDNRGSFDGWVRKIFVNTAIRHYHKQTNHNTNIHLETAYYKTVESQIIEEMSAQELLKVVQKLPDGYRTVFNMYAIEGYSHKEIGELLEIKESTSRSQLVKARKWLQHKINTLLKVAL